MTHLREEWERRKGGQSEQESKNKKRGKEEEDLTNNHQGGRGFIPNSLPEHDLSGLHRFRPVAKSGDLN